MPKGEPLCYDSIRNPKWIYMMEFFQFWILEGGEVKGRGAGFDAATPWWNFEFYGTLDKETIQVTIHHRSWDEKLRIVTETWTFDPKRQKIFIKNYPDTVLGVWEYEKIEYKGLIRSYFS